MTRQDIITKLEHNKEVFKVVFSDLHENEYLWREKEGSWSLLEVLCHLLDEEKEDFRMRVRHVLETPQEHPPSIDPVGWVIQRDYQSQNFQDKLKALLKERTTSIDWLRSLKDPKWNNEYQHPKLGTQTAQMYLENWLAHDYLHIRQINRIKYLYFKSCAKASLGYAGTW
ncbi:MAG: DinB family protein [Flavobacteriales bacterium]|nr:DinB family protein [Flavobacteriales bacterium]